MESRYAALSEEDKEILQLLAQGCELWRSTNADRNDRCWLEAGSHPEKDISRQIPMATGVKLINSEFTAMLREEGFNQVFGLHAEAAKLPSLK